MDIQLIGTIVRAFPIESGTKRDGGEWHKQEYLLSVENEHYPKNVSFHIFGNDRITELGLKENERVRVHLEIQAREYNGRYFNSINCWKVDRNENNQSEQKSQVGQSVQSNQPSQVQPIVEQQTRVQAETSQPTQPTPQQVTSLQDDDLPF